VILPGKFSAPIGRTGQSEAGRNTAHYPCRSLHPQGHPCARNHYQPGGPDDEGQAGGQAERRTANLRGRHEPPRASLTQKTGRPSDDVRTLGARLPRRKLACYTCKYHAPKLTNLQVLASLPAYGTDDQEVGHGSRNSSPERDR